MTSSLKQRSDLNRVRYFWDEFMRVLDGEPLTLVFNDNARSSLRRHGLTDGRGAGAGLTPYALKLIREAAR